MEKKKKPAIRFKGFTDSWEQRKVGDYYEFKNGLSKGKEFFGEGTPIVNFTDVFHNRGISPEMLSGKVRLELSEIKNYEVKKGDIFFTRTSETIEEIGYPSVMLGEPENTVFSGFVLRGRCFLKDDPLDNLFKKYIFFTDAFRTEMLRKSSMTTRALTSGTAIKNMEFLHPSSKEEQHKIGELLTNIDHLITLHQRKYDKLQIIKKSMLEKMFPQNGSCFPEIRFKGFTDSWEQRKVGDFLTESRVRGNTGLDAKKLTVKLWGKGVVEKNDFGGSEHTQYFTRRKGQFIYSKLDFLNSAFGVIPEKFDNYESTADLPAFDLDGMNPYFMYFVAIQESFYLKHGSIADGSRKAKRIHVDTFLNMPVMVPTIDEQNLIVDFLQHLDHLITLHQREVEKLQNIKKSMLETMFV